MFPVLSNLAGLWALLGVPLLVVVHCLQQRSRTESTSTLFLLEALAPESHGGRSWDWLRLSRSFWLQVAAVLLATWILVGPRWLRGESSQTVAIVLDSAVAMGAFQEEAVHAAEAKISASAARAAHTDWLILSSDPRLPPLYRGPSRANAEAALKAWRPRLGTHDYEPVLRLARSLTSGAGETWFITDSLLKVPAGQPAVGVGTPLANVGFAGVTVSKDETGWRWRALVKNHSDSTIRREWWLENAGARSASQEVEIPAGGLVELSGRLPDGASEATLTLKPDVFTADDRLPVIRSRPKQLVAVVSVEGDEGKFFQKLLTGLDGVSVVGGNGTTGAGGSTGASGTSGSGSAAEGIGGGVKPQLRVERLEATGKVNPPSGAAIFLPRSIATEDKRLMTLPVVAQRDELVADLNWQGLLGPGASNLKLGVGDDALLWQAGKPLVWLRPGAAEARQLVLNLDWAGGNASRLPAMVLLLRRFVENVRAAQPGFYAGSFDAGGSVPIAARDRGVLTGTAAGATLTFEPSAGGEKQVTVLTEAQLAVLRAPGEAGFFTLSRAGRDLVRGAVQFADARQSDFSKAEIFDTGRGPEAKAAWERATRRDPWVAVWLLLLGGLLMASWWPGSRQTGGFKR